MKRNTENNMKVSSIAQSSNEEARMRPVSLVFLRGKLFFSVALCLIAMMTLSPASMMAKDFNITENDTTQGEFAAFLLNALPGATEKLSRKHPALGAENIFIFFTEDPPGLGIVPDDGWQKDETIDRNFVLGLLPEEKKNEAEEQNLSFEELLDFLVDYIRMIFDDKRLGIARFFGQATGFAVIPAR